MKTKEEIAKEVYPDIDGYLDQIEHDRIQFIRGLEYSDQQTKELQEQLAAKESELTTTISVMQKHIDDQDELIAAKENEIDVCQKLYKTITEYFNSDSFINKQQVINVLDEYDLINAPPRVNDKK